MARTASPFQFRTIKNNEGDDYQRGIFHPERPHDVATVLADKFGDDVEFVAYVLGKGTGCRVKAAVERNGEEIAQSVECGGKNRDAATLVAFEALASADLPDAPESESAPESGTDAPETDDKSKKGKKGKGKKSPDVETVETAPVAPDAPEDEADVPADNPAPVEFDKFARIVRGLWTQSATVFAGGSASGDVDVAAHEIADLMDETERVARMCDAAEAADVAECVVKLMGNQRAILLGIDAGRIDGQRSRKLRKFVKRATDGATA